MYKVLIVEDDAVIASEIADSLKKWGYDARAAQDLRDVEACFKTEEPQLIIMDVSLPYFNGYYWCERIRRLSSVPIIFLSSRTESMDIVMGMNMGGDDYLTKPFSPDVLIAKVSAMLRRCYDMDTSCSMLDIAGGQFDPARGTVKNEEKTAELTKNETRILLSLAEAKGKSVSRETLMLALWNSDQFVDDNTLTVNIARLRQKLESIGLKDAVRTHKGRGYSVRGA